MVNSNNNIYKEFIRVAPSQQEVDVDSSTNGVSVELTSVSKCGVVAAPSSSFMSNGILCPMIPSKLQRLLPLLNQRMGSNRQEDRVIQSIQVHFSSTLSPSFSSSSTLSEQHHHHPPNGLHIVVQMVEKKNETATSSTRRRKISSTQLMGHVLGALTKERLVLAPLESYVSEERLHRFVYEPPTTATSSSNSTNKRVEIVLPDLSGGTSDMVGVEGFRAFLSPHKCGIFGGDGGQDESASQEWSDWWFRTSRHFQRQQQRQPMYGTIPQKEIWWKLFWEKADGSESLHGKALVLEQGLQFTQTRPKPSPTMKNVKQDLSDADVIRLQDWLPRDVSSSYHSCPYASATTPMILLPSSTKEQDSQPWYEVALSNPNQPTALTTGSDGVDCTCQQTWKVEKSLHRRRGIAYGGGSLVWTVSLLTLCNTNFDSSPTSASIATGTCRPMNADAVILELHDILPKYLQAKWSGTSEAPTKLQPRSDGTGGWDVTWQRVWDPQQSLFGSCSSSSYHMDECRSTTDGSTWTLSLQVEPVLLPFEWFPADPNRGIEMPTAILTVNMNDSLDYYYSNSLLFLPPVPDMSMPFNVMSLTCTLYAFVVGSMVNWMIRRASQRIERALEKKNEEEDKKKPTGFKDRIKAKLARLFGKTNPTNEATGKAETTVGSLGKDAETPMPKETTEPIKAKEDK